MRRAKKLDCRPAYFGKFPAANVHVREVRVCKLWTYERQETFWHFFIVMLARFELQIALLFSSS